MNRLVIQVKNKPDPLEVHLFPDHVRLARGGGSFSIEWSEWNRWLDAAFQFQAAQEEARAKEAAQQPSAQAEPTAAPAKLPGVDFGAK
jgi:hypothetical protein